MVPVLKELRGALRERTDMEPQFVRVLGRKQRAREVAATGRRTVLPGVIPRERSMPSTVRATPDAPDHARFGRATARYGCAQTARTPGQQRRHVHAHRHQGRHRSAAGQRLQPDPRTSVIALVPISEAVRPARYSRNVPRVHPAVLTGGNSGDKLTMSLSDSMLLSPGTEKQGTSGGNLLPVHGSGGCALRGAAARHQHGVGPRKAGEATAIHAASDVQRCGPASRRHPHQLHRRLVHRRQASRRTAVAAGGYSRAGPPTPTPGPVTCAWARTR